MRLVTIASLGASAALGVAALFVARVVLPAKTAAPPPGVALAAPTAPTVPVVVADKPLGYGVLLSAGDLKVARFPADAAPEGAFSTIEAVLKQDAGGPPVVLTPLAAKEPLLPAKISGPGVRPSVAAEISEGMRAYTVRVTEVSGVGGHALPGDRVDVVLTRNLGGEGAARNVVSEVVIQNVRVLGMDLNADPTSTKTAPPSTATLEVSVPDAQKLAIATDLGALSLALRPAGRGADEVAPTRPLQTRDAVAGAFRGPVPAGAGGPRRLEASPRTIQIIEGDGPAAGA